MTKITSPVPSFRDGAALSTKIFLTAVAFFSLSANLALAHATGQSLIKTGEKYIIDVGHDSITTSPVAGEPTAFDFLFLEKNANGQADYSDVVVDIVEEGGRTAFYADIRHSADTRTGMAYIFPKGGSYKFKVYYKNNGEVLDQAEFPLSVEPATYEQPPTSPKKYWTNFGSGAIVGMILLAGIIMFRNHGKKRKK